MKARRIVAVDDSRFMQAVIENILKDDGYEVTTLSCGEDALEFLAHDRPDLLLLDGVMKGMSGYEVLTRLRSDSRYNLLPIIMITGQSEDENKFKSLEMGADDYIVKPFNSRELSARVKNTLTRLERSRGANPLTGLRGNNDIEMELTSRLEGKSDFCVMYFDLNSFKPYNDVYGFASGDLVIKLVSDVICNTVVESGGKNDFIGHIGGDDFVVITEPQYAEALAKKIIEEFDERVTEFYSDEDRQNGYIISKDRVGNKMNFDIIGLAIAIIDSRRNTYLSSSHLAESAAALKTAAKTVMDGKSAYVIG